MEDKQRIDISQNSTEQENEINIQEERIEEFTSLLMRVKRKGMDKLFDFIQKSDFYTAPASTRYHSCHEGGLLEHSLNVYRCLMEKRNSDTWKNILMPMPEESLILIALLHDLCKTYMYAVEYKNKKEYSDHGEKMDNNGRYDWVSVPGYVVEDKIPYGHGEKSVMMIEEFIKLTLQERYAIRWHMGFTEPKENLNALGAAIRKYPIILAIHQADLEATYLLEKEE